MISNIRGVFSLLNDVKVLRELAGKYAIAGRPLQCPSAAGGKGGPPGGHGA